MGISPGRWCSPRTGVVQLDPIRPSMRNGRCGTPVCGLAVDAHVNLDACRHGGLTELGDAGATEFEGMAASMHKTPHALRLYVKRSEAQRISAARKRRLLAEG